MAIVDKIDAYSGTSVSSRNIKEALDKLANTGEPTKNIEDAMAQVVKAQANPLERLSVNVDIAADTDLLGKVVGDLQENVVVSNHKVSGYLKYVTEYTGFSGDASEQQGNYVALHCEVPNVEGVTITCKINETTTLDEDGIIVFIIKNKKLDKPLEVTASKQGFTSVTKKYSLAGLVLEPEPEESDDAK